MQIAGLFMGLMAAQQARKAAEIEAQAYEEQKDLAEIQSGQQEIERNKKLRMQLAALSTSMSGQGISLGTSSSTEALRVDEERTALADVSAIKLMGQVERRKFSLSAASSRAKGQAATMSGFAKTAGGIYGIQTGNMTKVG
jgi:hypothetical protein